MKTIFFKPKNKSLARKISIVSPTAFRRSINLVKKNGLRLNEYRALVLAKNRAKVSSMRKHLSVKERKQFKTISKMKLPKYTRKK